jgi:hypothetical protein
MVRSSRCYLSSSDMADPRFPDVQASVPLDADCDLIRSTVHRALAEAGYSDDAVAYLVATDDIRHQLGPLLGASRDWVAVEVYGPAVQSDPSSWSEPPVTPPEPPPARAIERSQPITQPTSETNAKQTAKRVEAVAQFVETVMWVVLALSVIGGVLLVSATDSSCGGFGDDCSFWDERPLFGLGVGLAIGGVIQCSMIIMVAADIRARADGSIK